MEHIHTYLTFPRMQIVHIEYLMAKFGRRAKIVYNLAAAQITVTCALRSHVQEYDGRKTTTTTACA